MLNKKLMILAMILVLLLAVSAVNATDNATENISQENIDNEIQMVNEYNIEEDITTDFTENKLQNSNFDKLDDDTNVQKIDTLIEANGTIYFDMENITDDGHAKGKFNGHIKLTDVDGNPLEYATIRFHNSHNSFRGAETDDQGEINFADIYDLFYFVKSDQYYVFFEGDDIYSPSAKIPIFKELNGFNKYDNISNGIDTVIEVDENFTRLATDYSAGERGAFFYAVLKDSNANPLVNKTVYVYVNGVSYSILTDEQGRCGLQINLAAANNYLYTLYFLGDDTYNPSAPVTTNLTVVKKTTWLNVDNEYLSFDKGEKINFNVTLNTIQNPYDGKTYLYSNKQIILKLDTGLEIMGYANSRGMVKFDINTLNYGHYIATVEFEGDRTYEQSNKTITIDVISHSLSIIANDTSFALNEKTKEINATLKNLEYSTGSLVNKNLTLKIADKKYDGYTNENGVASFDIESMELGTYVATIEFGGDDFYEHSTKNINVTFIPSLTVDLENSFKFSEIPYVNISLHEKTTGNLSILLDDYELINLQIVNHTFNIPLYNLTIGNHSLEVKYYGDDVHNSANIIKNLTVFKMPTTLTGESTFFDEEQSKAFTTELKDDIGDGVEGQTVKIEVIKYSGESATFNGISNANGITVYDVGILSGGMWYVAGIYEGNQNYIESSFVDKFIVVRMATTTDIEEISNPQVNHTYKLKANIHDGNGKLVKEGILQFYLDGVDIGSIDLSKNQGHQNALGRDILGAVNPIFEYKLGADEDISDLYLEYTPSEVGEHKLLVVYEGTTIYKASNSTTTFTVTESKTKTTIAASEVTAVYNGGKYLVATLKDVNGKVISGVKITVILNGKTSTPTTDKNGQVKVSLNGLVPKTYYPTITFTGNSNYNQATKSVKVTVKKATPKLTAKAKTFKKSVKTKKYTVTLKNNKNKSLKKVKLSLKVKGKTYYATTNNYGKATFKITKLTKKGKYTAILKFKGSKYYTAKTVKPKITIK